MRMLPVRRILLVVAAFTAVSIYLIWWVTYAGIHYTPRYNLRPPGASGDVQGASVRLLSLIRSDKLAAADGGQPGSPEPGAVWIVAELEAVRHDPAKEFLCGTELVGPEWRRWTPASLLTASAGVQRSTPSCPVDLSLDQPLRFEALFLVPARYANQLLGIALRDDSTAARTTVIRPPAL
jgi:hypothetical protein